MEKELIIIVGPSGAGKSTLANNLKKECDVVIGRQVTTRKPREDDGLNNYIYINIEEFENLQKQGKFAISSGRHGRRYGILKSDVMLSFAKSDKLIIITSYKDIEQIKSLNIRNKIVVLTFFEDIKKNVEERIRLMRINNYEDIKQRVNYALMEHEKYFVKVKKYADVLVYTDIYGIEQTKNIVKLALNLKNKENQFLLNKTSQER